MLFVIMFSDDPDGDHQLKSIGLTMKLFCGGGNKYSIHIFFHQTFF